MMSIRKIHYKRANIELDIERQLREFAEEICDAGVYVDEVLIELVDTTTMDGIQRKTVTNVKIKLSLA